MFRYLVFVLLVTCVVYCTVATPGKAPNLHIKFRLKKEYGKNCLLDKCVEEKSCIQNYHESYGLECLSCINAANINECLSRTATCDGKTEECFLDVTILNDLSRAFSAGCRGKQVCSLIASAGKRNVGSVLTRKKNDLVQCAQCCNTNTNGSLPCNAFLCSQKPVQPTGCFVCNGIADYTRCQIRQQCPPNEMCFLETRIVNGGFRYNMGCERKLKCDYLLKDLKSRHGRRFDTRPGGIPICSACCSDSNCNKANCFDLQRRQLCNDASICAP